MSNVVKHNTPRRALENADADAVVIGDLYCKARASMVESVEYLIECGHRLTAKKKQVGHGNWLAWLGNNADVLGFNSVRTADRLMHGAAKLDASVEFDEIGALQISRDMWGHLGPVRGTTGTGNNEWNTPEESLDPAREVLGEFDLDPASSDAAQRTVKAKRFFTSADDGLKHEWHGKVWLNPPYAQPFITDFVAKLLDELKAGHVTEAIMLTHNYTSSAWFRDAAAVADAICFTDDRVRFVDPDGARANPTQGQAFFYFGPNPNRFADVFEAIGFIVVPRHALTAMRVPVAEVAA